MHWLVLNVYYSNSGWAKGTQFYMRQINMSGSWWKNYLSLKYTNHQTGGNCFCMVYYTLHNFILCSNAFQKVRCILQISFLAYLIDTFLVGGGNSGNKASSVAIASASLYDLVNRLFSVRSIIQISLKYSMQETFLIFLYHTRLISKE